MKKIPFYTILGLCFGLMLTTSCSSSEDNGNEPIAVDLTPLINVAMQGTWRVTHYTDHGDDKASKFDGYIFTFGPNDVLTATNGTETRTGVWIVSSTPIAPYQGVPDQSPDDPIDFNIYFLDSQTKDFTDINDDWDRITVTDTKMEFIDVSAEPGKEPDYITFEKN